MRKKKIWLPLVFAGLLALCGGGAMAKAPETAPKQADPNAVPVRVLEKDEWLAQQKMRLLQWGLISAEDCSLSEAGWTSEPKSCTWGLTPEEAKEFADYRAAEAKVAESAVTEEATFEKVIRVLIAKEREREGLTSPVNPSAELMAAARVRAAELAKKYGHTRPKKRGDWFTAVTHKGERLAELICSGKELPEEAIKAWMLSPLNRKELLDDKYTDYGVAQAPCKKPKGTYYWVILLRE